MSDYPEGWFIPDSQKPAKKWVVGFMFSPDREWVVLIWKNKPAEQKGRANGVGGKIEAGETPMQAMIREFEEEAGVHEEGWEHFCTLSGDWGKIYCFAVESEAWRQTDSMTDEKLSYWKVEQLNDPEMAGRFMSNLAWMIPMALSNTKPYWPYRITERIG